MDFKKFNSNVRNELKKDSQFTNGVVVGKTTNMFNEPAYNVKIIYGNNLVSNYSSPNSEVLTRISTKGMSNEEVSLEEGDNVIVTFLGKDSNSPVIVGGSVTSSVSSSVISQEEESPDASKVDTDSPNIQHETPIVSTKGWRNPFLQEGWKITCEYKKKGDWSAGYHTGIDFGIDGGCEGKTIVAACGGKVVLAGYNGSYGNCVIIDHSSQGSSVYTLYAHMKETPVVAANDMVASGQTLGKCGNTGNSHGAHLHFEVRITNKYADVDDPLKYIPFSGEPGYTY